MQGYEIHHIHNYDLFPFILSCFFFVFMQKVVREYRIIQLPSFNVLNDASSNNRIVIIIANDNDTPSFNMISTLLFLKIDNVKCEIVDIYSADVNGRLFKYNLANNYAVPEVKKWEKDLFTANGITFIAYFLYFKRFEEESVYYNKINTLFYESVIEKDNLHIWVPISHMAIQLLINCKLRRSQSSLHTARRCIPNVPTYISNDHEHQNGTINSSLVGVIIGDWKFYNHQGLCFNSKRSIRVGLMDITCGLMISQDRNLIRLFVTCIVLTDWTNMA
ncbi:hypothetical protein H8356DRAFT_1391152 [Neocallimastix lanati (nom. inval.)]|nr:hypothetical protein H8356DRAFT_1391152 [Neocallimastix sp. JGI-2020a]